MDNPNPKLICVTGTNLEEIQGAVTNIQRYFFDSKINAVLAGAYRFRNFKNQPVGNLANLSHEEYEREVASVTEYWTDLALTEKEHYVVILYGLTIKDNDKYWNDRACKVEVDSSGAFIEDKRVETTNIVSETVNVINNKPEFNPGAKQR